VSQQAGHLGVNLLRPEVDFAGQVSVGARSAQEDYSRFSLAPRGTALLAVLADGVGGQTGGEVASKTAVDAFLATFNASPATSVPAKLGAALNQVNTVLAVSVNNRPELAGMGCTLVGVHIGEHGLQWISVGDSPLFLFRGGKLIRLNADHSMKPVIEEAVRQGKISQEDALRHPDRNSLRSAVSGEALTMIDTPVAPMPLNKQDVVLLASDGLLTLSRDEIVKVMGDHADALPQVIANALVTAVASKQKPQQDNTTVQVVKVPTALGAKQSSFEILGWILAVLLAVGFGTLAYWINEPASKWLKTLGLFDRSEVVTAPAPVPVPVPAPGYVAETPAAPVPAASAPVPKLLPAPAAPRVKGGTASKEAGAAAIAPRPPASGNNNESSKPIAPEPGSSSKAPMTPASHVEKSHTPLAQERSPVAKTDSPHAATPVVTPSAPTKVDSVNAPIAPAN
jgi:serine/threonine protein phosphatase PrpC